MRINRQKKERNRSSTSTKTFAQTTPTTGHPFVPLLLTLIQYITNDQETNTMDQINHQLKALRNKLHQIPALEKAEVSER
jgi:hypothetical protein